MISLLLGCSAFSGPVSNVASVSMRVSMVSMDTGVAQRWNVQKGYGFIKPDDGGEDVFVHTSAITDGDILEEGAPVTFVKEIDESRGKARASSVTGGLTLPPFVPGEGFGGVSGPPPEGMFQGVAKRWNDKGFTFIKPDEGGPDLFCHFSSIEDGNRIAEGATVHFYKEYDDRNGKERAAAVRGGFQEEYQPPRNDYDDDYY